MSATVGSVWSSSSSLSEVVRGRGRLPVGMALVPVVDKPARRVLSRTTRDRGASPHRRPSRPTSAPVVASGRAGDAADPRRHPGAAAARRPRPDAIAAGGRGRARLDPAPGPSSVAAAGYAGGARTAIPRHVAADDQRVFRHRAGGGGRGRRRADGRGRADRPAAAVPGAGVLGVRVLPDSEDAHRLSARRPDRGAACPTTSPACSRRRPSSGSASTRSPAWRRPSSR